MVMSVYHNQFEVLTDQYPQFECSQGHLATEYLASLLLDTIRERSPLGTGKDRVGHQQAAHKPMVFQGTHDTTLLWWMEGMGVWRNGNEPDKMVEETTQLKKNIKTLIIFLQNVLVE